MPTDARPMVAEAGQDAAAPAVDANAGPADTGGGPRVDAELALDARPSTDAAALDAAGPLPDARVEADAATERHDGATPWGWAGCNEGGIGDVIACPTCVPGEGCAAGACVPESAELPHRCDGEPPCEEGRCLPRCDAACLGAGWPCFVGVEYRPVTPDDQRPPPLVCWPPSVPYLCKPCEAAEACGEGLVCASRVGGDGNFCVPPCGFVECSSSFGLCRPAVGVDGESIEACLPTRRLRCECDGTVGTFAYCERDGVPGVGTCRADGAVDCAPVVVP